MILRDHDTVITSYSIHYTKLYDPSVDGYQILTTINYKLTKYMEALFSYEKAMNLNISSTLQDKLSTFIAIHVITSYSIHYTKLYEARIGEVRNGEHAGDAGEPEHEILSAMKDFAEHLFGTSYNFV